MKVSYWQLNIIILTILLSIWFLVSCGFGIIWSGYMIDLVYLEVGEINRGIQALGLGVQTIGYFFIAFSHTIKSFFPKSRYFRSVGVLPLFFLSTMTIEHIIRSFSFILLVYGAIETFVSFLEGRQKGTLTVGIGLALLAFGEFIAWYSLVFPESVLYSISILIKISGLISLFIPVSKLPLRKIKLDDDLEDDSDDSFENHA